MDKILTYAEAVAAHRRLVALFEVMTTFVFLFSPSLLLFLRFSLLLIVFYFVTISLFRNKVRTQRGCFRFRKAI